MSKLTRVPQAAAAGTLILRADPRRMYVEWWGEGMQASMGALCPGPFPVGMTSPGSMTGPLIWKFKDAPAIVTGEFYAVGVPLNGWVVIEQLYVGG